MGSDPRTRAAARDAARRQGLEPPALEDGDILTAADIDEIHKAAQRFRGERMGGPGHVSLDTWEMVCSRSEYVAMAEALLRLSRECDEARALVRGQFTAAFAKLRETLGSDLGHGGGFIEILDGIESLRKQRDELLVELALARRRGGKEAT